MRLVLEKPVKRTPSATETACLAILAGGAALVPLQHALHSEVSFCPMHAITTLPCPLCGGTRAVTALVHGDLSLAVSYNPLALAIFAGMLAAVLWYLLLVLPWRARPVLLMHRWERRAATALFVVAFIANWVYVFTAGMYKVPLRL